MDDRLKRASTPLAGVDPSGEGGFDPSREHRPRQSTTASSLESIGKHRIEASRPAPASGRPAAFRESVRSVSTVRLVQSVRSDDVPPRTAGDVRPRETTRGQGSTRRDLPSRGNEGVRAAGLMERRFCWMPSARRSRPTIISLCPAVSLTSVASSRVRAVVVRPPVHRSNPRPSLRLTRPSPRRTPRPVQPCRTSRSRSRAAGWFRGPSARTRP